MKGHPAWSPAWERSSAQKAGSRSASRPASSATSSAIPADAESATTLALSSSGAGTAAYLSSVSRSVAGGAALLAVAAQRALAASHPRPRRAKATMRPLKDRSTSARARSCDKKGSAFFIIQLDAAVSGGGAGWARSCSPPGANDCAVSARAVRAPWPCHLKIARQIRRGPSRPGDNRTEGARRASSKATGRAKSRRERGTASCVRGETMVVSASGAPASH